MSAAAGMTAAAVDSTPPRLTDARRWAAAAVAVAGVFLAAGLLGEVFAPAPAGPEGSSYATSTGGVAAWAELLSRAGHPVDQLREPLAVAALPARATVVVLGADRLDRAEAANLGGFVRSGGRLVIGGGDPRTTLPQLLSDPPRWAPAGPSVARASAPLTQVRGVGTVRSAGEGAWTSGPGRVGLDAGGGRSLLIVQGLGAGTVTLLADSSPVENRLLGAADNAQLAVNLAGPPGSPVVFAEGVHGFGASTGLAAIPGRWWVSLAGLFLAAGAWALSRGRRLGPAQAPEADPAPPRSDYVLGVTRLLLRARGGTGLTGLARAAVMRELSERSGSAVRGRSQDPVRVLGELGFEADEVDVVLGKGSRRGADSELVLLGRALARLAGGR